LTKIGPLHGILLLKQLAQNKERILKAVTETDQITYTVELIKITADFSTENLKQEGHGGRYFKH
jgi:hypothetical protein